MAQRKTIVKIDIPKEGLGDKVEKVLKSKPVNPITEAVKRLLWKDGEDCGCDERKQRLNKIFKRTRKPKRCLTQEQYVTLKTILPKIAATKPRTIYPADQPAIKEIWESVFSARTTEPWCTRCPGVWTTAVRDLNAVFKVYEEDNQKTKL